MEPLIGSPALASLANANVLLAFDFDGTLAPIVDDPASAAVPQTTRRLLAQVSQIFPCAVISGRTEAELSRLLSGVTVWYAIGNRYLDLPEQMASRYDAVRTWLPVLSARLAAFEGISVEDKGAALALHYRGAADGARAQEAIRAAAESLRGVRLIPGKQVVNLVPQDAAHKGAAVDRLRVQLGCEKALYVGDDGTDEDAFGMGPEVVGVRVGAAENSLARYCLRDRDEVDDLLARLLSMSSRSARRPEAIAQRRPSGRPPV
jgi:trehalose 6-phosphate phosphatase